MTPLTLSHTQRRPQRKGAKVAKLRTQNQERYLGEFAAAAVIEKCLICFDLSENDLPNLAKSDPRKMIIAGLIRYPDLGHLA